MYIIGVTGSFGTGKSTVAALFKKHGAAIIDADAITRGLIEPTGKCYKKVAKIFPGVILTSGKVNRALLASIVFNNPRELKKLTNVVYPEALTTVKDQLKRYKSKSFVILDVPLLFEAGWDKFTDLNITVTTTKTTQIQRLKKKLGLTPKQVHERIKLQLPLSIKKQRADIIINNNGNLADTSNQVKAIIQRLQRRKGLCPKQK